MTIIDRRHLLKLSALGAATLAAPAFVRTANARTRSLTVASLFADDKPETKIWVKISELVEAKLPGRFRFNIVKSGALGGEKEVAESGSGQSFNRFLAFRLGAGIADPRSALPVP